MEQMHIILKRLRKQKGLSQEALAELLGISAAAVSKWENAITQPDISQIVPLTNIFGVSADELFGIRGREEKEETDRLLTELYKLEDVYPPEQGIHIIEAYRETLKNHPNNLAILSEALAFSTMLLTQYNVLTPEEEEDVTQDSVRIADRILKYSDSEDKILHTKHLLIDIYCHHKQFDKALEIADSLPESITNTRDIVRAGILWKAGRFDEEKELHIRNTEALLSSLETEVSMLANRYKEEGNHEDALFCYRFAAATLDALYGKEKYRPPYIRRGISAFGYPAQCLMKLGRDEEALDVLENFAEAYLAEREGFNKKDTFDDNPLLRGRTYRFGYDGNAKFEEYYQNLLEMPCFDSLRNTSRFQKIVERLAEA